ncbi:hypothetical protein [Lachnospira pectinoschiza]|uniref:Superinfection exclusion protein B n=1 Tax=Lachnospira pectinoschiza TaxID=28052 RepID=A0A1G9UGE2_9FIRM|nr:hypothetical protein [Lachnospira pectinoschiza]SDM58981.1 hypothetical protein SAMN05216544_0754 [Lachnospira pectinoschiza]
MEAFGKVLEVLFEKRLIPTMAGLVIGVTVYVLTPDQTILLEKLGRNWYILFFAAVGFLGITLIHYLYSKISEKMVSVSNKRYNREMDKKREREDLQEMWDFIDSLSLEDREFIKTFLKNNNAPIVEYKNYASYYYGIRDNTDLVKRRDITDTDGYIKTQFVLSDRFYKDLKNSMENYGRIGNFVEEK